jgi:hypothetical protein
MADSHGMQNDSSRQARITWREYSTKGRAYTVVLRIETFSESKEGAVNSIQERFARNHTNRLYLACAVAVVAIVVPSMLANTKPTEFPAQVVGHLVLKEAPGNEMLLQNKGDKHYLYLQKASKQGFTVVDVTKPSLPALLNSAASSSGATAGKLEMAGPDVGIAEIPDRNAKGVIHSSDNATETVNILDLTDPAHPKVIRTFKGVTSTAKDPARGLFYLANNDGLWILRYPRIALAPAKKKPECGSEDALSGMPPDCE